MDKTLRHQIGLFAVAQQTPSSSFYMAATAVLVGLLITWIAAEARAVRDELIAEQTGSEATSHMLRIPKRSILPISVGLAVGAVAALWALSQGRAETWQTIVVWASLALGFVSVPLSVALATSEIRRNEVLTKRFGFAKRWGPPVVALIVGLIASPVVLGERLSGAKFPVYGTCLTGGCGLKQRSGPGPAFTEVNRGDRLTDGKQVHVVCQIAGSPPKGYKSPVWDQLPNGRYVSDAFVDTPNRSGGFSEGLSRC